MKTYAVKIQVKCKGYFPVYMIEDDYDKGISEILKEMLIDNGVYDQISYDMDRDCEYVLDEESVKILPSFDEDCKNFDILFMLKVTSEEDVKAEDVKKSMEENCFSFNMNWEIDDPNADMGYREYEAGQEGDALFEVKEVEGEYEPSWAWIKDVPDYSGYAE